MIKSHIWRLTPTLLLYLCDNSWCTAVFQLQSNTKGFFFFFFHCNAPTRYTSINYSFSCRFRMRRHLGRLCMWDSPRLSCECRPCKSNTVERYKFAIICSQGRQVPFNRTDNFKFRLGTIKPCDALFGVHKKGGLLALHSNMLHSQGVILMHQAWTKIIKGVRNASGPTVRKMGRTVKDKYE